MTVEALASHAPGADRLQRPLLWCSRVQQRLMRSVEDVHRNCLCQAPFMVEPVVSTSSDLLMCVECTRGSRHPLGTSSVSPRVPGEAETTVTAEHINVFFYGLFRDMGVLKQRGPAPRRPQVTRLDGYDIDIRERATLIRNAASRVYGIVTALTQEAAHIQAYSEAGTFDVSNGLLLRADIHTLFDLGSITIDIADMTVITAQELKHTVYADFDKKKLHFPKGSENVPDRKALHDHHQAAIQRQQQAFVL